MSRSARLDGLLRLAACVLVVHGAVDAEDGSLSPEAAARFFGEAREISAGDGGRTWGVPLYGPMLLVDRQTRRVIANRADGQGRLERRGDVFVGTLPEEVNCANTATEWADVEWTMLVWPLPEDPAARASLMIHELFHRIQDEVGLPAASPPNNHLDSRDGRIWLQLEWRALRRAIERDDRGRRRAVADALTFRAYRRALFAAAADEERRLELNEGLAEDTGLRVASFEDTRATRVTAALVAAPERPTFTRSFAYVSGPAYGILLDALRPGWRGGLDADSDLGRLLGAAIDFDPPADLGGEARRRAADYDGTALIRTEDARERARQQRLASHRARLIEGPLLILRPGESFRYGFNPNNLESMDGVGTVFPTLRVSDDWGILEVDGGALLVRPEGSILGIQVPAPTASEPSDGVLRGDGWSLTLHAGWSVVPADRFGDYRLRRDP